MEKLRFDELESRMRSYNREHNVMGVSQEEQLIGYIVFDKSSFEKEYPIETRTFSVASGEKYFISGLGGSSLYGMNGNGDVLRLDYYIGKWKVEYCYFKD